MEVGGSAERLQVAQALGVLELIHPKPGVHEAFNAQDYSRIDFRSIIGQWQQLHPEGRSLVIVFGDGAVIEISNFFSGAGSAGGLIAQIDDATYVSPELFLLKYVTVGAPIEPHGAETYVSSGADFHDPSVDPMGAPEPLALLPPEALPSLSLGETLPALTGTGTFSNPFPVNPFPPNPVPPAPDIPALNITKDVSSVTGGTLGGAADNAGDVINYTITVENTGNVALTGVSVTDPNADSAIAVLSMSP
jgi:hypothetical protein